MLQPKKIKATKETDIYEKLRSYVDKNYSMLANQDKTELYFLDIKQNRDVICKMTKIQTSIDQLIQNRLILTTYINELLTIKSKITFGRESFSCNVKFTWTDTLTDNAISSNNIYFEIYNCLYNLAITYYLIGDYYGNTAGDNRETRREAVLSYKKSLYCFKEIKEEAYNRINRAQLPLDMTPSHISYYMSLCEIYGQMEIVDLCGKTTESELRLGARLVLYISEVFDRAYKQSFVKPTKNIMEPDYQEYLKNRVHYYRSVMYEKLRDSAKAKFDKTGKGFGEALFFQGKLYQRLTQAQQNLEKCQKYVNVKKFKEDLNRMLKIGQDMQEKNEKIYHQAPPTQQDLVIEAKILAKPLLPDDLFLGKNKNKIREEGDKNCPNLNMMIPNETRDMIMRFKKRMTEYFSSSTAQSETEGSIKAYIQSLNLPDYITVRSDTGSTDVIELPPQLWNKIQYVQKLGGTLTLTNMMQEIMGQSNYLMDSLHNTLNSFSNEENDDNLMRQKYGAKWIRKSSNMLNGNYIMAINNHIQNLEKIRTFDMKQNDEIVNNAKYFETLLCPKKKIMQGIPGQRHRSVILSEEEENLREEILKLYELSDELMDVINPTYERINDDSLVINYFVEVLEKRTTEQAIYAQNKESYDRSIKKVAAINELIKERKEKVEEAYKKAEKKIEEKKGIKLNENDETMKYFQTLDNNANLYNNFYEKINKGKNYYDGLQNQIEGLLQSSNLWMIKRNEEKNVLISSIRREVGGMNYTGVQNDGENTFSSPDQYRDPSQNFYTNMGVKK